MRSNDRNAVLPAARYNVDITLRWPNGVEYGECYAISTSAPSKAETIYVDVSKHLARELGARCPAGAPILLRGSINPA